MFETVISKAGKLTVSNPSETLIIIPSVTPTSLLPGVPLNVPVAISKPAHEGLFTIKNVRISPSTSFTVGVKLYVMFSRIFIDGVPSIVGASIERINFNSDISYI